ncbi:MAG: spore coat protein [Oscillospiraceae bacterium]|jgi:spore coat protein CotF|nr:spore coat protein [Oscillospiraceae bacterium]
MNDMTQATQLLTDRQILQDSLMSQKQMTGSYNTFAGECANPQLRSTMLNILTDEHTIQADIFCHMQSKGWYQVEQADQNKIQQTKQKVTAQ